MVAGPWRRPLGFSVGPVTPTVFNPSELTDGAYIVRLSDPSQSDWVQQGIICRLGVSGTVLNVFVLGNANEHPYTWNGSSYEVVMEVDTHDVEGFASDMITQLYIDDYTSIPIQGEVADTLPDQLIAIIDPQHE